MTSKPSILLTGSTGSVGATLLEQLLAADYHVNAILRSSKKSQSFLEKKYARNIKNKTLKFTEIPDMTISGVFDEPASEATYIVHVATPLAYTNFEEDMMKPAIAVDHNILKAAKKSSTVKRVVITGSVVAVLNPGADLMSGKTFAPEDFNSISREEAMKSVGGAYAYSKVSSEKMAWEFMKTQQPKFDLVVLLAPAITGRCIQEGFVPDKKALGGMGQIYGQVFDKEPLGFMVPWIMDVDDVAAIHVKALENTTPGNQRYLFHIPELVSVSDVARKIREEFPELKTRVSAPASDGAGLPNSLSRFDTSKSDAIFGTKWKSWWESVKETVEDILEYEVKKN